MERDVAEDESEDTDTEDWRPIWLARERATARLIQRCFKLLMDGPRTAPEKLHALCKLTWITKGHGEVADNTRSVVVPALESLLHEEISSIDKSSLVRELSRANVPSEIVEAVGYDIGFVNFYAAFRNSSQEWITTNRGPVWTALSIAASARNDADARRAYGIVDSLPPLPRPKGGDLPAFNLLTPLLACLDPRERSPVVNSREAVKHRLRWLGLANGTLVEQFDGLVGLINQAGLDGALALDTASDDVLKDAFKAREGAPRAPTRPATPSKPLAPRQDEDIEFLRAEAIEGHRLLHNKMTNALLRVCKSADLVVEEGLEKSNLFDARVRRYIATERDLLIEVKTSHAPAFCRLAVGQLLDYRRQLDTRASTDVAVLFPGAPDQHAIDFLGFVGVKVLWFSPDMSSVEGDVILKEVQ